jgi:glycosyltransferase involved in cell wall biosynthesis
MRENKVIIKPLISIVIPCYNDWQYVEQAVNSALNQTYPNKEVIVVDDGSNKKTKLVLKTIEPRITKLITQENQGQSTARNIGIKESKGDYIMILDSDDFFEPTFTEKAVSILSENNAIKIVTCYSNLIFENATSALYKPNGGKLKDILMHNIAMGSVMFRKNDCEIISGFDESMRQGFEDWEFYMRLLSNSGLAYVIKEALFNYRRRLTSTTTRANKKKYELLKYIYSKNQDLYKENFVEFISFLLSRIEREEAEKIKNTQRIEFKIGKIILTPIRILKSLINK